MLLGVWRPVILLPLGITESCTPHDLRAMLLHELAHVRRWDLLVVWLYQLEKVLFFFHPVLWLAGREIRKERESACDDLVLSRSAIARRDYAAGFISALRLANRVPAVSTAVAMAEPFEVEKRRLMMILREASPRLSAGWIAALVVVVAAGLPTFGNGVASTRPTVEMISSALRQQVEACGDSLQIRYSVSRAPRGPALRPSERGDSLRSYSPSDSHGAGRL